MPFSQTDMASVAVLDVFPTCRFAARNNPRWHKALTNRQVEEGAPLSVMRVGHHSDTHPRCKHLQHPRGNVTQFNSACQDWHTPYDSTLITRREHRSLQTTPGAMTARLYGERLSQGRYPRGRGMPRHKSWGHMYTGRSKEHELQLWAETTQRLLLLEKEYDSTFNQLAATTRLRRDGQEPRMQPAGQPKRIQRRCFVLPSVTDDVFKLPASSSLGRLPSPPLRAAAADPVAKPAVPAVTAGSVRSGTPDGVDSKDESAAASHGRPAPNDTAEDQEPAEVTAVEGPP